MKQLRKSNDRLRSLVLVCVVLFSGITCAQKGSDYSVDIIYSPKRHIVPSQVTQRWKNEVKDSIVLFFESGFKNDDVTITTEVNKTVSKLTSSEVTQFAKFIPIAPLRNQENFSIQINSGKVITLRPDNGVQFIAVNFVDNKVIIRALDDFPYYD